MNICLRNWCVFAASLLLAGPGRADVSITPGTIHGTVHFTADVVPSSMRLDAVNPPSDGTQYPSSVIVNAPCATNGQTSDWCYSVTVESALTNHYYLRPVFTVTVGALTQQISLPEYPLAGDPLIPMPLNGNVLYDISYTPAILSGLTGLTNNGSSLPGQQFTLIAHDVDATSTVFPDAQCASTIGGICAVNSTVYTPQSSYEVYLKPNRAYVLQAGFTWAEPGTAGGSYTFDFDYPYASIGAGNTDTRNYTFTQQASVSGNISIDNLPLSQVTANVRGSTTTSLPGFPFPVFGAQYFDYYLPGATSSSYLTRILSDADFSKPMSLLVDVSFQDGSFLQAPAVPLNLAQGQNLVIDYNASPATIAGALTFNPPRPLNPAPKSSAAHVLSNNFGLAQGYFTAAANGGTFSLPAIPDNGPNPQPYAYWQFFGLSFDMGPNFTSDYVINGPLPLTPNLFVSQAGVTYPADFSFDTAFVDVFFTAPAGTLISDPFLDAVLNDPVGLGETAHAEGLNQSVPALQAEAQLILRVPPNETQPFVITPSALVTQNGNTSRAAFSPFSVVPTPGGVIKVEPPLVLSVSSPTEGQAFDVCTIPVIGTAGGAPIGSVTVSIDGHPAVSASIPASPIPGDPNRVSFNQSMNGVTGPNTIVVTAIDVGAAHTVSQTLHVSCASSTNQPPAVVCPQPVSNACGSNAGATQTLTAQPSDPDGDALTVTWTVDGVQVQSSASSSLTYTFSDASHVVEVSVSDGVNPAASCTTSVTVSKDATPPQVTVSVGTALLWPPNHDLVNVGLAVSDSDSCDASPDTAVGVFSNESDQEETGSGNFSPDARNSAAGTLRLRSERKGNGSGRVYLIVGTGTDDSGDEGFDCATVVVPHDQSKASIDSVNQQAAAARATCKSHGAAPAGYVQVGTGPVVGPKQ